MTLLDIALLVITAFALVSFGAALIFFDMYRKQRKETARALRLADTWEGQCHELRGLAGHWCCEAIKLEKSAAKERDERLRWEREYAAKLSHRVN